MRDRDSPVQPLNCGVSINGNCASEKSGRTNNRGVDGGGLCERELGEEAGEESIKVHSEWRVEGEKEDSD